MSKDSTREEEELEEAVEPDKVFDCFNDGCDECTVCKYLNFREWAEGCAPAGSSIERNHLVEDYLKRKATTLHQELQKAREDIKRDLNYIHYNLRNAIRNERDGLNVKGYEGEVDKWLSELAKTTQSELDQPKTLNPYDVRVEPTNITSE